MPYVCRGRFGPHVDPERGPKGRCEPCHKARAVEWNARNPERRAEINAKYREKPENRVKAAQKTADWRTRYPEKDREAKRLWYENNKDYARAYKRILTYGVDQLDVDLALLVQDDKCAICSANIGVEAAVDHCHSTGRFRGMLCSACNTGIGLLKDSPAKFSAASRYVLNGSDDFPWEILI